MKQKRQLSILILKLFCLNTLMTATQLATARGFEECILEKMKGQVAQMHPIAAKACEAEYPYERVIESSAFYPGTNDEIEHSWGTQSGDEPLIYVEIKMNISDHRVTKVVAEFTDSCDDAEQTKKETFILDQIHENYLYKELENASSFKCMRDYRIYGIHKGN